MMRCDVQEAASRECMVDYEDGRRRNVGEIGHCVV